MKKILSGRSGIDPATTLSNCVQPLLQVMTSMPPGAERPGRSGGIPVHDPRKRKRSSKACDRCRLKKIKCDGENPCDRCQEEDAVCLYGERESAESKTVSVSHVNQLQLQQDLLVAALRAVWSTYIAPRHELDRRRPPSIHEIVESMGVLRGRNADYEQAWAAFDRPSGASSSSGSVAPQSSQPTSIIPISVRNPTSTINPTIVSPTDGVLGDSFVQESPHSIAQSSVFPNQSLPLLSTPGGSSLDDSHLQMLQDYQSNYAADFATFDPNAMAYSDSTNPLRDPYDPTSLHPSHDQALSDHNFVDSTTIPPESSYHMDHEYGRSPVEDLQGAEGSEANNDSENDSDTNGEDGNDSDDEDEDDQNDDDDDDDDDDEDDGDD